MPETTSQLNTGAQWLPNLANSEVALPAPGAGPGFWVGASSAIEVDGEIYMAYRWRKPLELGRGGGMVVARSVDGVKFETVAEIGKDEMDTESLERPALVLTEGGKWRLYASCATTGTKHWRVEMLEANDPAQLTAGNRRVVLPGADKLGVKDPVIRRYDGLWHLWASCHPLDVRGQEDRMVSNYATSKDGLEWTWHGTALDVRPGKWDSRGARITAVVPEGGKYVAFYDGRASAEENYDERTGIAVGSLGYFESVSDEPAAESQEGKALRYLDVVPLANGNWRLYYEVARPDGSHELRTELRLVA